jgi:hypothetical protein
VSDRLRLVSGFKLQFRSMNFGGRSDLAIGLIFTFLSSALRSLMSPGSGGSRGFLASLFRWYSDFG